MQYDSDIQRVQNTRFLQSFERSQSDDDATFHVCCSRSARDVRIHTLEALKRMIGFEHRIEMSDEQHVLAFAVMPRDQMTCTAETRTFDPLSLETQGIETRAEDLTDLSNAFEIHRAAVDVHDLLQQRDCIVLS